MKGSNLAEPRHIDYEKLTLAELEAAAEASTAEQRRLHLNRASELATAGETARRTEICFPNSSGGPRCPLPDALQEIQLD
jgi:hypothetical protein